MLRSWMLRRPPSLKSLDLEVERQSLESGMAATLLIMNDDFSAAEARLHESPESSFRDLAAGLLNFLKATLGMEPEVMQQASKALMEAERSASKDARKLGYHSAIYPAGAAYTLCFTMSQLMSAVLGVLNEDIIESIKGFYKLRKSYQTLEGLLEAEKLFLSQHNSATQSKDDSEDNEFYDAAEYLDDSTENSPDNQISVEGVNANDRSLEDDDIFKHPMDSFVHTGSNLCFGLLLLMLSLIPPSFGRILAIIGFRGSRDRGLRMLWQASESNDVNGAFAALTLQGFYNGIVSYCDVLPEPSSPELQDAGIEPGYPRERLAKLANQERSRHPEASFWQLEEQRLQAIKHGLDRWFEVLEQPFHSKIRQIEGVAIFERGLMAMFTHRYEECSDTFVKCVEVNNFSPALYYYTAACAQVLLYRTAKTNGNADAATIHEARANELFNQSHQKIGKMKVMARPIPFEAYTSRKIKKWEARARDLSCSFIDAIGVSPMEELIFFWNGTKKMGESHLRQSLDALAWSENENAARWKQETKDEKAILHVLRAAVLRCFGRTYEARALLEQEVLAYDRADLKGSFSDDWPLPVAHYEMAVNLWHERVLDKEGSEESKRKVAEALTWAQKTAKWESFDLDARIGMRVSMAVDTIKAWQKVYPL